jgi:hypothetical protein
MHPKCTILAQANLQCLQTAHRCAQHSTWPWAEPSHQVNTKPNPKQANNLVFANPTEQTPSSVGSRGFSPRVQSGTPSEDKPAGAPICSPMSLQRRGLELTERYSTSPYILTKHFINQRNEFSDTRMSGF